LGMQMGHLATHLLLLLHQRFSCKATLCIKIN
jgi:hypothetical protein